MATDDTTAAGEVQLEADDDVEGATQVWSPQQRMLVSEPKDYAIGDLYTRYEDGRLNVHPEFQRYYVFDAARASRLVESVLMGVPIPVVYLAEENDYSHSVIDGQQRLTALFRFLHGDIILRGLKVFDELNGQRFSGLQPDLQRRFREGSLRCIIVKRESDPDIRFEIFERLNTGSVNLNPQELRNCIYRGPYNDLLNKLAGDSDFQKLFGRKGPDKRMRDREEILRFFALCHNQSTYKPPMKGFLNREMRRYRSVDQATASELTQLFAKSVKLTLTVFGGYAFRRFYPGTADDHSGRWEPQRLNMALYDAVMVGFTHYEMQQVVPRADAIRDGLIELMVEDAEFVDSINLGTSEKARLSTRILKWGSKLHTVLGAPGTHPRLFPPELKRQLFDASPICEICRQTILVLDDAHVDHIEQWHLGGQTVPENARLTHRYCNVARPRG